MTTKTSDLLKVEFTPDIVVDLLPEWKGEDVTVSVLSGGITNKLYRAYCSKGDVAIRVYGDKTEMFIDRDREYKALTRMAEAKITTRPVAYLPDKHVTIVEFLTGAYTLKNEDFVREEMWDLIVDPIRRIHTSGAELDYIFNPYEQCMKLGSILDGLNVDYPEFDIKGVFISLKKLNEAIDIPKSDYVLTHNDLLADNFIQVTEDSRNKFEMPMYIIDWEYAAMGPKYYDLSDMFQEILVPRRVEKKLVEHYCEGSNVEETLFYVDMFRPYPDIFWFLWSLIQNNVSSIDFDFYNYGKVKYENTLRNIEFLKKEYGVKL